MTTTTTTAKRRRRRILRAIEANPSASDRKITQIAKVDRKTVAAHRGEFPALGGEFPNDEGDEPDV